MLPLGLLTAGEKGEIIGSNWKKYKNIRGISDESRMNICRIDDMGLRVGKMIEMLNNEGRGPLLVKIDNSRLAIGRKMAMKIMVRRCES